MEIFKLRWKIFLTIALIVAGLLAVVQQLANRTIDSSQEEAIRNELQNTAKIFNGLLAERRDGLRTRIQVLAESTQVKAALDTGKQRAQDPATVKDTAETLNESLGLALFQVAGRKGLYWPASSARITPTFPSPRRTPSPPMRSSPKPWTRTSWASPKGPGPRPTPSLRPSRALFRSRITSWGPSASASPMDDDFAKNLKEQTGSEVVVLINGRIFASSLAGAERQQLSTELGSMIGMAQSADEKGIFQASLGETPYLGQFIEIKGTDGKKAADLLQLRSKAGLLSLLSSLRSKFIAVFVFGLAAALLVAFFLSRSITKPLDSLIAATRQVDQGNLDFRVQVDTKDELNVLADSFNDMLKDLKEKERVKGLFGRYLPKAVADKVMGQEGELELGGEQKDVAILFSDIRGFTAISERMAPPELVAMLNDYYTRMIDVLFDNGGTLDKTIGDAIMAVFGAPVKDPDAAAKAVRTALGMQEALKQFNRDRVAKGLEPFEIGIVINTGVVEAGNLGSVKQFSYTVIGDEVNLPSRMCSVAKTGQIIITEATYRKVKWLSEFNRLEPVMVKNVSQPVQIYEVLGVKKDTAPQA